MSFTIIDKPEGYQPIYNDLEVVVSSTNSTQPKYKFVMDVSIADASLPFTSSLGRFRCNAVQNESTLDINGYFNLKSILSSAKEFQTWPINPFQKQAYSVSVQLGEEYAPNTSAAAVYYSTSAFSFVGFNGALPVSEYEDFDYLDFINPTTIAASSGVGLKFLTSLESRKVLFSSDLNLDLLNNSTSANYLVSAYNGNTLLTTTSGTALGTFFENYKRTNFGASSLGLPANTTRYTIDIRRGNGNNLVTQYPVTIDDTCTIYPKVNVYYQNKYGAEDVFVFTKKSKLESNISRQNYDTARSLNTPYSRQGTNTYSSKITRTHTLNSNWLTQVEADALSELVESNNVFIAFDGEYISGSKAQFTLTIGKSQNNEWEILNSQTLAATKSGPVSLTLTLNPDTVIYDTAIDLYLAYESVIAASNWDTYFDIDSSGVDFDNIILVFTAKQKGTSFNLTGITDGDQMTVTGYTDGVDEVIPKRIPVKVDNATHEYKNKINDNLIQIELTVTEKANYTRQC